MRGQESINRGFLRSLLDTLTGTLLCTWLALTAALLAQNISRPLSLLVIFVPAVGVVARFWGFTAAMLGLTSTVFVFCAAVFAPIGRMEVASADARTGIFWVALCAGVAAYVFARRDCPRPQPHEGGKSC